MNDILYPEEVRTQAILREFSAAVKRNRIETRFRPDEVKALVQDIDHYVNLKKREDNKDG